MSDDEYDDGGDSHYSEPEPSYHEPSPVPSYRAPSSRTPTYHEPSIRASSLEVPSENEPRSPDSTIREPSIREPTFREPSIHPQSVHDSDNLNSHHGPPHRYQAEYESHEPYIPSDATEQYHHSYNSDSENDSTNRISHDHQSRQSDHSHYFGGNDGLPRNISGHLDQDQLTLQVIALMYPTPRSYLSGDSVSRASSACGDGQSGAHGQDWDSEGYDGDDSTIGNLDVHHDRQPDDGRSGDRNSDIKLEKYERHSVGNMVVAHGCSAATHVIQRYGGQSHSGQDGSHHGDQGNWNGPVQRPDHKEQLIQHAVSELRQQHHQAQHQPRHNEPHHAPNRQTPSIPLRNHLRPTPLHPANCPPIQPPGKFTHPHSPIVPKVISPYDPTTTQIETLDTSSMATTAIESVQRSLKYKPKRMALCIRVCGVAVLLVCVVLAIVLPIAYTRKS